MKEDGMVMDRKRGGFWKKQTGLVGFCSALCMRRAFTPYLSRHFRIFSLGRRRPGVSIDWCMYIYISITLYLYSLALIT